MIELIYISNTPNTLDRSTILEILNSSHTKNKLNDLTGIYTMMVIVFYKLLKEKKMLYAPYTKK